MKYQVPVAIIDRSRSLRRNMTNAERSIWRLLREHFKEWHFRRQVPIGPYFADFASHRARLIIEIDGGQHSAETDTKRTESVRSHGYRVIRFWNDDALGNPEGVFEAVSAALTDGHPTPSPSPSRGGE
jgi:very-short-patch-repair endonuclease